jgi:hypothetical protein
LELGVRSSDFFESGGEKSGDFGVNPRVSGGGEKSGDFGVKPRDSGGGRSGDFGENLRDSGLSIRIDGVDAIICFG